MDECKPLPAACRSTRCDWADACPSGDTGSSKRTCSTTSALPPARGSHSFTLELNLSNSRTRS